MTYVDNKLGDTLIKHHDAWNGDCYLQDDLTFTSDRSAAARFYILKSGNTRIQNGDMITINTGNKTLAVDRQRNIVLRDRDQITNEEMSFILTDGSTSTAPISYDSALFILSDRRNRIGLKFEWEINSIDNPGAINHHPGQRPYLTNTSCLNMTDGTMGFYHFKLEKADGQRSSRNVVAAEAKSEPFSWTKGWSGAVLVVMLMIILVLSILVSR